MCNEQSIITIVEIAKRQEKSNPKEASKYYLEAAQMLLEHAKSHPKNREEKIKMSEKMYKKARRLKNKKFESKKSNLGFDSIGGLEELKEEIRFKIIQPMEDPELFKYYGKSVGGGILMYGPPGCGKSLIAKATAYEAKVNFIHVKSSDLKSKFVGETEKNIAELFEKAREKQPTIIFFDEFEVLGMDRSVGKSHEKSAVAQLLTEMDGMDAKEQQILLLAATNEPWSIDPALRREGRFGTTIFIPPPDEEAREAILKLHMTNRPVEEIDYLRLAKETKNLSGADLKAVCEIATSIPLKESYKTKIKRKITMVDMRAAIGKTKSIMTQWFNMAKEQVIKRRLEDQFSDLIDRADEMELICV
jgi:transitional endoplasmic reticulum ATPase